VKHVTVSDACKAAGKLPDIGSTGTGSSIGDVANAGQIWVFMIPRQPESTDLAQVLLIPRKSR